MMKIYTKSRAGKIYDASATYKDGQVIVHKGSIINRNNTEGFKPKKTVATLRSNDAIFDTDSVLNQDIVFNSLSTAATFVTGRVANGLITWKTEDGKYVRFALQQKED